MKAEVVPFGKYKGRPVEDMIADQDYMTWIGAQPWFRERFGHMLEAHDRVEAEATPIHNRLQALFLEPTYCAAFVSVFAADTIGKAVTAELRSRAKLLEEMHENLQAEEARPEKSDGWYSTRSAVKIDACAKLIAAIKAMPAPSVSTSVAFEAPQDVVIRTSLMRASLSFPTYQTDTNPAQVWLSDHPPTPEFAIEIKPVIGDDYPVVLRQMQRNRSQYLFIGRYEGVGVTQAQFVGMFAASGKKVIFKQDVDDVAQTAGRG
jgi:uncharacterized protein (DUF3820 family)